MLVLNAEQMLPAQQTTLSEVRGLPLHVMLLLHCHVIHSYCVFGRLQALRELLGGSDTGIHRTLRESACALARQLQGRYGRASSMGNGVSIAQLEQFLRCMDPAITTEQHRLDAKAHWQDKLKISDAESNFPARLVLKQLLSGDDRVCEQRCSRCAHVGGY